MDITTCLHEFARDYKIIKTAVAQIQAKANLSSGEGKMAIHKVSFELLSLIPFLSDHAQSLVQKFAEGYLQLSKSEDPLVEQIIHDILAQQKQDTMPAMKLNSAQTPSSLLYEQTSIDKSAKIDLKK